MASFSRVTWASATRNAPSTLLYSSAVADPVSRTPYTPSKSAPRGTRAASAPGRGGGRPRVLRGQLPVVEGDEHVSRLDTIAGAHAHVEDGREELAGHLGPPLRLDTPDRGHRLLAADPLDGGDRAAGGRGPGRRHVAG